VDDLDLERVAAAGWPAEEVGWLGDWMLRAADGFTMRANSVLPLGDPGVPLDEALARAADWYRTRGLPLRLSVPSPACDALGRALDERGWRRDVAVRVMVAPLDDLPSPVPGLPPVAIPATPTSTWVTAFRAGTDRYLPPAGRRLLVRPPVVGFAEVREGGRTVALARGTVTEGWLGLTGVVVVPDRRRAGLATHVLGALAEWARARDATCAYLQVAAPNATAIAAWSRSGFVDHHRYEHRSHPA
jgi:GNAT superfamily N-acetyltransferase